jgi:hypothetical protein
MADVERPGGESSAAAGAAAAPAPAAGAQPKKKSFKLVGTVVMAMRRFQGKSAPLPLPQQLQRARNSARCTTHTPRLARCCPRRASPPPCLPCLVSALPAASLNPTYSYGKRPSSDGADEHVSWCPARGARGEGRTLPAGEPQLLLRC